MKKIIYISILVALASVLSFVDKTISMAAFPTMFFVKMGLANIVVIFVLYEYDFQYAFTVAILKSIIGGLLFGGLMTFAIGLFGTILSFLGMYFIKGLCKNKISVIGVSIIGGFLHMVGQLIIAGSIYQMRDSILFYGGYMILISLITSIIIGIIANIIIKRYNSRKVDF